MGRGGSGRVLQAERSSDKASAIWRPTKTAITAPEAVRPERIADFRPAPASRATMAPLPRAGSPWRPRPRRGRGRWSRKDRPIRPA